MLDFRKALVAVTVAGLGLVASASAQVYTTGTATQLSVTPGYAALESVTAQLPTISIPVTATSAAPSSFTLTLTANVPFTNVPVSTTNPNLDVSASDGAEAPSTITQPSPTVLQLTWNTVTAGASTTITVSNLRVNASLVGNSSAITITPGGVPGGGFTTTIAATPVAYVVKALAPPTITGAANTNLCSSVSSTSVINVATLTITEGFPMSLPTAAQSSSTSSPIVAATQGARLAITFSNLNPGVTYYVPSSVSNGGLTLVAYPAATGSTPLTAVTSPSAAASAGLVALTVSGSTATVYYGATANTSATVTSVTIPLSENIPSLAGVTSFSSSPVAVSISLVGPSSGYPQFSSSATPYTATQTTVLNTNGLLISCSTTFVAPYVLNASGFDSGIIIANASNASGGSGAAGSCVLSFYGTGAPSAAVNTGNIPAGSSYAAIASKVAPGFDGYVVVTCNFQGGHMFVFLVDGTSYVGYVPPVVANGSNTAFTPVE